METVNIPEDMVIASTNAKRKSFEDENTAPANTSTIAVNSADESTQLKKTRFRAPIENSSSTGIPKITKVSANAVGRPNAVGSKPLANKLLSSNVIKVIEEPKTNENVPCGATAVISVETPSRSAIDTPGSNRIMLTRSSKKTAISSLAELPFKRDMIASIFQSGISLKEDKITSILAPLKSKNFARGSTDKEKIKKYEKAIADFRSLLTSLSVELSSVQDNCQQHEQTVTTHALSLLDRLKEATQQILGFQNTEQRMKRDLVKFQSDNNSHLETIGKLQSDIIKLRQDIFNLETSLVKSQEMFRVEEISRQKAEAVNAQLEKELASTKVTASESLQAVRDEYNQRIDQSISGYRDEIVSLKTELGKRQIEADRINTSHKEADSRYVELKEDTLRLQAQLREAEQAALRFEQEATRQGLEVSVLKEQSSSKDLDLRSTLQSFNEIQRQANDEKNTLRYEISGLQSRIKIMEEEKASLLVELSLKREDSHNLTRDLASVQDQLNLVESRLAAALSETQQAKELQLSFVLERELRSKAEVREEAERRERIAACAQLIAVQSETNNRLHDMKQSCIEVETALREELSRACVDRDQAVSMSQQCSDSVLTLQSEVSQLKQTLERQQVSASTCQSVNYSGERAEEIGKMTGEIEILRRKVRETNDMKNLEISSAYHRIKELEEQVRTGEQQRRKLHNTVQELRGNIRVFARVRPFLPSDELDLTSPNPVVTPQADGVSLKIIRPVPEDRQGGSVSDEHMFTFDRVFGQSSSQEAVFQEVSEFVQSALDGYNVCLFSYGQTGSGKTHTMQGSGTGPMRGIIPRAMEQIGVYKRQLEERGEWRYSLRVSYVEIYNENIRDLLRSPNATAEPKLDIKHDAQGHVHVSGATMRMLDDPTDCAQIEEIMELAAMHRSVHQTAMNERSSRSHAVFTMHLTANSITGGASLSGSLSLVDLAGSERLERSQVSGVRLKETVSINKSLSALIDVFSALAARQQHIPFRNSKLTYLLQSALSGDGKTLMLANLSPTEDSYGETLCSLRLASQVNQCELGKPKRQLVSGANGASTPIHGHASSTTSHSNKSTLFSSSLPKSATTTKTTKAANKCSKV